MWLAGAVGMTAALGYYAVGAFVCALAVVVLLALKTVDRSIDRGRQKPSEANPNPGDSNDP
jgi:uncharacterized membrane protein YhiD involved in acid resistance